MFFPGIGNIVNTEIFKTWLMYNISLSEGVYSVFDEGKEWEIHISSSKHHGEGKAVDIELNQDHYKYVILL